MVELQGAISLIDGFPALSGVDLVISEGEIVLLQGPNGAGKSTLLRLCAGLASLDGGTGMVLGNDLARAAQRRKIRREVGLLAHQNFLYDELTVEQNMAFWSEANRANPEAVGPILDRLGLSGRLATVRASNLSAGQRRRVALAVMVSRRPKLWLLDEPHAGLDPATRDLVDDLVGRAVGFGATVMIASHDVERVGGVAARTVEVTGGQVTALGGGHAA